MNDRFTRTEALLGSKALNKLSGCRVAIFGAGGVGGYVTEALARSGIGAIDVIDGDEINRTNINRQILALESTIGQNKASAAKARINDINPDCTVSAFEIFYNRETESKFDFSVYDYIIDAIDSVTDKLGIIQRAKVENVPVISCMGAGNKLSPTAFKVADISKTSVCPLARVMRRELKKLGITHLKTVYSEEPPVCKGQDDEGRRTPASCAFVPSVAGLIIAAEVIGDLIDATEN